MSLNVAHMLLDIGQHKLCLLLNSRAVARRVGTMKQMLLLLILTLTLGASISHAATCFADYKAKKDAPLRLHYGVLQLDTLSGFCTVDGTTQTIARRLEAQGWTLLQVMSTFGAEGLQQRKDSAGQYYLRF